MAWLADLAWWQILLLSSYAAIVVAAFLRHVFYSYEIRSVPFLTRRSPKFRAADAPLVSILVPAKDEADGIEACLRSLCGQDYPNLEILVVDDRSRDNTAAIVERWAAADKRLRLLRVHELPPQWTGKSHALHECQKLARGEWFFFVDADTRLHPSCLSILLRDCLDSGADVESLMPKLVSKSFWACVVQPMASTLLMLVFRPSHINDRTRANNGFANGQFILVRRDAYRKIGGHEAVRNQIGEDVQLARLARRNGLSQRIVVAPEIASCRMYTDINGIINGWSRIFYFSADSGAGQLWKLAAALSAFSLLPYLVMLASGGALLAGSAGLFVRVALGLAVVHEICQWTLYGRVYRDSGASLWYLPFRVVGVVVMLHVLRKASELCRTHELTWRGTSYDATLREGTDQRRAAA